VQKKIEGILPVLTTGFGDQGNGEAGGEEEDTAVVVLGVGRLGMRRSANEGSSECGAERRRRGCIS
jgi:hypothetical protein